jgi:hypothetical protein
MFQVALWSTAPTTGTLLRLQDFAAVYARHLTQHLKKVDKQGTPGSSKFFDAEAVIEILVGANLAEAVVHST